MPGNGVNVACLGGCCILGWAPRIGMGTVLRWILGWMPHIGKDAAYQDGGRVLGWMTHTRVDAAYWGGVVSIRMSGEYQDGQSTRMGEKNKDERKV